MKPEDLKITRIEVNIKDVKPYAFNPRNNDSAVEKLMESIKRFSYTKKIVTDGALVIIAGHTRLKALTRLGYEKIEVDMIEPISSLDYVQFQIEANKMRIVDNKTAEGSGFSEKVDDYITADSVLANFFEVPNLNLDAIDAKESIGKIKTKEEEVEIYCPDCGEPITVKV